MTRLHLRIVSHRWNAIAELTSVALTRDRKSNKYGVIIRLKFGCSTPVRTSVESQISNTESTINTVTIIRFEFLGIHYLLCAVFRLLEEVVRSWIVLLMQGVHHSQIFVLRFIGQGFDRYRYFRDALHYSSWSNHPSYFQCEPDLGSYHTPTSIKTS